MVLGKRVWSWVKRVWSWVKRVQFLGKRVWLLFFFVLDFSVFFLCVSVCVSVCVHQEPSINKLSSIDPIINCLSN